jgi:Big-like domain-containing protein
MSRQARILTPILLAMLVLSGCFGCQEDTQVFPNTVFFVPPDPVTLNVGDSKTVFATALPVGSSSGSVDLGTTTYSSSNSAVATVDATSGKVTCVSAGSATITATNVNKGGSGKANLQVTCNAPVSPVPSLDVTPTTVQFTHTVGTTTCPQKIGTLHITSHGSQAVTVTIAPAGSFVTVATQSVVLQQDGSTDVDVFFNCTTAASFTTTVTVTGTNSAGTDTKTVTVTATIAR